VAVLEALSKIKTMESKKAISYAADNSIIQEIRDTAKNLIKQYD
jgi:hypothetical protein